MIHITSRKSRKMTNAIRFRIFLGLCFCLAALIPFTSCRDKTEKHSYSEVKGINTPVAQNEIAMPKTPVHTEAVAAQEAADAGGDVSPFGKLNWHLPEGWTARAGSGMFYAKIKTSGPKPVDIGVLSLQGEAGGLEANAERWAGQLGLELPSDAMKAFVAQAQKIKSKGNMDVTVLDFGSLIRDEDGNSMLVAVTKPQADSYFIKMMGKKSELAANREGFLELCKSLVFQ